MQQQCLTQLRTLKLSGMVQAAELQWSQPQTYDDLGFDERLGLMVNQELTARANKRLQRLIKAARFKVDAQIEDIDYAHPRGLKKSQLANLITGEWIIKKQNLLITGPTGCGKTYLACAIGRHACHYDHSVRYYPSLIHT